jgi:hypothetical protein
MLRCATMADTNSKHQTQMDWLSGPISRSETYVNVGSGRSALVATLCRPQATCAELARLIKWSPHLLRRLTLGRSYWMEA